MTYSNTTDNGLEPEKARFPYRIKNERDEKMIDVDKLNFRFDPPHKIVCEYPSVYVFIVGLVRDIGVVLVLYFNGKALAFEATTTNEGDLRTWNIHQFGISVTHYNQTPGSSFDLRVNSYKFENRDEQNWAIRLLKKSLKVYCGKLDAAKPDGPLGRFADDQGCQRRSKSSPLGRSKTSPLDVKQSLVLRVVPVVHR
ncbi:MAG: hypothetical protein HQ483_19165, partial [Rhodospirillales bacterium]|nr:hypothetical protein [Rhodospirillales bacterium]